MINIKGITKFYDKKKSLDQIWLTIKEGSIYGLVGDNGAGKTTLIKHIVGVLIPESGEILIDDIPAFEDIEAKSKIGYVADEIYFMPGSTMESMAKVYKESYGKWNQPFYEKMVKAFELNPKEKLSSFSKGMQKQVAIILALSTDPKYLILDEPLDGLDPMARKRIWKEILKKNEKENMAVLISSHNLKEMEDYCHSIGIISKGKLLVEREIGDFENDVHKIQVGFKKPSPRSKYVKEQMALAEGPRNYEGLDIISCVQKATVDTIIVKGDIDEIEKTIKKMKPAIFDILPLNMEEIFWQELGGDKYDK